MPFRVRLGYPVYGVVCAGWYLDGAPIPDFQNSAFRVGPEDRLSGYTLRGDALAPGRHVLEFRCNTGGLPGIEQAGFTAEILVLEDAAASAGDGGLVVEAPAA